MKTLFTSLAAALLLGGCQTTESICLRYAEQEVYNQTPKVGPSLAREYGRIVYNQCAMADAAMQGRARPSFDVYIRN